MVEEVGDFIKRLVSLPEHGLDQGTILAEYGAMHLVLLKGQDANGTVTTGKRGLRAALQRQIDSVGQMRPSIVLRVRFRDLLNEDGLVVLYNYYRQDFLGHV